MPPLILMYHRVAEPRVDPWGLAVSPFHFAEQMSLLRRTRHPLGLTEFVERWRGGSLPEQAVAVTFDDGYADNLHEAKPRLDAADVPATVFLATGFLDQTVPFWWDELAELILAGIRQDEILLDGTAVEVGPPEPHAPERRWFVSDGPATQRQKALVDTWSKLLPAGPKAQEKILAELRAQVPADFVSSAGRQV